MDFKRIIQVNIFFGHYMTFIYDRIDASNHVKYSFIWVTSWNYQLKMKVDLTKTKCASLCDVCFCEREFLFTLSDLGISFLRVASCALILSRRRFSAWLWLLELEAEAPPPSSATPSIGIDQEGNPWNWNLVEADTWGGTGHGTR